MGVCLTRWFAPPFASVVGLVRKVRGPRHGRRAMKRPASVSPAVLQAPQQRARAEPGNLGIVGCLARATARLEQGWAPGPFTLAELFEYPGRTVQSIAKDEAVLRGSHPLGRGIAFNLVRPLSPRCVKLGLAKSANTVSLFPQLRPGR